MNRILGPYFGKTLLNQLKLKAPAHVLERGFWFNKFAIAITPMFQNRR